jgi:hypothetical protein
MTQADDKTDLEFLRDVAASGAHAPLLGGRFFLLWGGLAAVALLAHYAVLAGMTPWGQPALGAVWAIYGLTGGIGSAILGMALRNKPGHGATPVRAERAVWSAMTFAIFAYVAGAVLGALILGTVPMLIFDTIPLVAFLGYGISFSVTSALGGPGWMRITAIASLIAAGGGVSLVGRPELYLYCAAIVFILAVMPGLALLRQEPAAER